MTRRNVDIPDELWQALKIEAAVKGITIKELVRRLLSRKEIPSDPR